MAESSRRSASRNASGGRRAQRLDATDIAILDILQSTAKITNTTLAERVGISPPSMIERVKKLEAAGVITGYVSLVDPRRLNKSIMAIVHVSLREHSAEILANAKKRIAALDEVLACWYCAGDEDFILKVIVEDMDAYEAFISEKLSAVKGIGRLKTSFVLDAVKESTRVPLDAVPEANP